MDIKFKQNHVNINMKASGGIGTKDHSKLTNLDYEHSGHTGFASAAQIQELLDLLNNKQDTLIAGDNISIVDNIISATGLTKDEIYIGPDEPTDPNIKIWIDTNEVAQEFYTKEEIDAKNFATQTWVSAQGYLTQHQDLSEYAKKSEIPTKVSAFENDAGYLTQHQDLSEYALKTEIPTVPTNVSAFNNDAGYLTEHQSLADYALKTELPSEYVKSATVQGNKLTLTNKDNTTVEFEPSGGGSGGLDSIKEGAGNSSTLFNYKVGENDEQSYGYGTIDSQNRGTHQATGKFSNAFGYLTLASGNCSFVTGAANKVEWNEQNVSYRIPTASGYCSFAGGLGSTWAKGDNSFAYGMNCIAYKENSVALGDQCFSMGSDSFSTGTTAQAMASSSSAFGYITEAVWGNSMVIGQFNMNNQEDRLMFVIGNGTGNTPSTRKNIFTVDEKGNVMAAGTVSSSTGADYAEYFEWKDGNPNNEDRVGYIVTLDGDKIVKANTGDDVLGICSGTAMVLGDSAESYWNKKFVTDDFGRLVWAEQEFQCEPIKDNEGNIIKDSWIEKSYSPLVSPDYDGSKPYIKRSDRPEWQIVGMMGKIYVRDDGTCVVNGYADVKDGIATKANGKTNMRVMERVTDNIVRVLMK